MKQHHKAGDMKFYSYLTKYPHNYTDQYAQHYRRDDDTNTSDISHAGKCQLLSDVTKSFDYPLYVLDLGCGTGRYFHCVKNLRRLVGVDVSLNMLLMAKDPVCNDHMTAPFDLVCGNLFEIDFKQQAFDVVYCVGVLGVFCPLDSFLLQKIATFLKRPGKFFFTVVDDRSPRSATWRSRTAQRVRSILPYTLKRKVNAKLKEFPLSELQLRSLMEESPFCAYEVSWYYSATGRIDLHCLACLE